MTGHAGMRLHSLRTDPMTLEEAHRIQANFDRGVLDPDLPGTMELVNEAHRRSVTAQLWGNQRPPSARVSRGFVVTCCAIPTAASFAFALAILIIAP